MLLMTGKVNKGTNVLFLVVTSLFLSPLSINIHASQKQVSFPLIGLSGRKLISQSISVFVNILIKYQFGRNHDFLIKNPSIGSNWFDLSLFWHYGYRCPPKYILMQDI